MDDASITSDFVHPFLADAAELTFFRQEGVDLANHFARLEQRITRTSETSAHLRSFLLLLETDVNRAQAPSYGAAVIVHNQ